MPPPGATEKASQRPSGDHRTWPTWSSSAVTGCGQPPSAATVHTCGSPERLETKAIWRPSGEKLGDPQKPTFAIRPTSAASCGSGPAAAAPRTAPSPQDSRNDQGNQRYPRFMASVYATASLLRVGLAEGAGGAGVADEAGEDDEGEHV